MERSPSGPLGNMRIAIVAHVLKYAEADDLLRYLLESQVGETAFIGLPLEFVEGRPGPRLRRFRDGKPTSEKVLRNRKLPPVIQYVADFCLALFWLLTANGRWDLIVACDNLNASAALMTRRLGRARKVVYWTIDFVPERFPQPRLNSLYHRLDRFCLAHADVTWNVSDGIARGREEVRGLRQADYPRQVTVPIGGWFDRLPRREFSEIEPHSLVYSGGLLPHQGLELVLDAVPLIVHELPDFRLYITGMGPLQPELEARARGLGVAEHVRFLGYLETHEELHDLLSRCAAGVAMYSAEMDRWTRFADPAKIKLYLSAGLPVLTTSVPHLANQIQARQAGEVIPFEADAFATAAVRLLDDPGTLQRFRANALAFGSEFNWPRIFARALADPRLELSLGTS